MRKKIKAARSLMVGAAVGIAAVFLFLSGALKTWSNLAGDRLFLPVAVQSGAIVVAIDDASLAQIGRWPWPRKVHAQIIDNLSLAGASVVAYDVNFSEASDENDDAALEDAIKNTGKVVLPVELNLSQSDNRIIFTVDSVVGPLARFSSVAAAVGHSNAPPDSDGVMRRMPLEPVSSDGVAIEAFAVQAAKISHPDFVLDNAPTDELGRLIINFNGSPKKSFTTLSAADVMRGDFDADTIRGKSVFVGATAPDLHDDRLVPTSLGVPMSGVEIHASLYETLISGRWLVPLAKYQMALLIFLLAVFTSFFAAFTRARISLIATAAFWLAFLITAFYLFDRGKVVDLVWPSLTLLFAYAGTTLERRVAFDRDRSRLKTAFSRYVSSEVVQRILKDPSALRLGGEKRTMTVLFSDIRGFTSISEKMPPEDLVEIMNAYLTRMTEIVFANGGTLDKYIGDAVMAFWNAPLDQPDHAERAVKTALEMQEALKDLNAQGAFPAGVGLKIGIGVNTGEMVVGNMGSEMRFDYTVLGDNVNLASRIESLTKEYAAGILISEATKDAIGASFRTKFIDTVKVRGKNESVKLYAVDAAER
ncbi:MAG: adenylate/guanylate cyclase domain-containing protein [Patescibacteria group bacterium]